MSDFEARLTDEYLQLGEKIAKLGEFISSEKIDAIEVAQKSLLKVQYGAMKTYSRCLSERMELLGIIK